LVAKNWLNGRARSSLGEAASVIACDKRYAFAQGSESDEAIHSSLRGEMGCFAEPVIGRPFSRPGGE
jgi:hypothetical protein